MKYKVSELEGAVLDAAVGKALGLQYSVERSCYLHSVRDTSGNERFDAWRETPSTRWEHGGSIIERERIMISPIREPVASDPPAGWCAMHVVAGQYISGRTPLVAAMRAYVASKLGDEVELP